VKKLAPSVKAAIKAKKVFKSITEEPATEVALSPVDLKPAPDVTETRKTQPQGDRAGIKACFMLVARLPG